MWPFAWSMRYSRSITGILQQILQTCKGRDLLDAKFKVPLSKLIEEFNLSVTYTPKNPADIFIESADINRPGLQLAGFFDFFDHQRIQVLGNSEITFMKNQDPILAFRHVDGFFEHHPPAVIIARGISAPDEMLAAAKKHEVPLLGTKDNTSYLLSSLIATLNVDLAPRITRHAVLMEVFGDGILLLGESGIGKSETAVELIVRGHRLIADDAVEIRRVSSKTLVGSSPDNIRHFMELRGIGVINASRIYGMSAVKVTEKIDMIIQLEQWNDNKVYDRLGMDNDCMEILGIRVPSLTIPVKPGRNLAVIIEVAAMNNRLKRMGYHPTQELMKRLGMPEDEFPPSQNVIYNTNWSEY